MKDFQDFVAAWFYLGGLGCLLGLMVVMAIFFLI